MGVAHDRPDSVIGGAVIDEDEFVVDPGEGLVDLPLEQGDVFLLIVEVPTPANTE